MQNTHSKPLRQRHFDRSLLPPSRTFYERELGKLGREDRNGWSRVRSGCPFHASESKTSFYVHRSGGFYCHGCNSKGGDVVAFMRQRYNLSFKQAAQELGCWVTDLQHQREIHQREQDHQRSREQEADRQEQERAERIAACRWLHATETLYREAIAEHNWILMAELLPALRQAEAKYCELAGIEVGLCGF